MPAPKERPVRKDVARNRQRLLDAGKEVFAAQGLDATLDDIARHAGVGAGTAYRHFGSRQEIINAIFADVAQSFIADAEQALTIDDAWTGLVAFIEAFAERQATDRGLHQVFTGDHGAALRTADWHRLISAITALVERAKRSGQVRADVQTSDVVGLFAVLGPAYDLSAATSVAAWRRYVDFFLRAIQISAPAAVIPVPPAISLPKILAIVGGPAARFSGRG